MLKTTHNTHKASPACGSRIPTEPAAAESLVASVRFRYILKSELIDDID